MAVNRIEELLNIMEHLLSRGWKVPLSGGKAVIYASEGLELIEEIRTNLPDEVRKAEDITHREELIIDNAKKTAELIVQKAEEKACLMLNETEILKKSQAKAQDIISESTINAREIKESTYKFLDDLLNKAENGLQGCLNDIKSTKGIIKQGTYAIKSIKDNVSNKG